MVFGLALKDLVDQIRSFVEKEVKKDYLNLKTSHGIDSQSSSGRLKKWSSTFLKYENINGNDAVPKLHGKFNYAAFDCRIMSHVDYAKLYLENYMAKFTVFDEHCDASAVLNLLGRVPVFSLAAQSAAHDVRQDRNTWAHCAFQDWDPAKFQQCFQDMKRLVNALGLPAADETKLLADLNTWEKTGTNRHNLNKSLQYPWEHPYLASSPLGFIVVGKAFRKAFRILAFDGRKCRWVVEQDFMGIFVFFLPFYPVFSTESCSLCYGLKDLFLIHKSDDKVFLHR